MRFGYSQRAKRANAGPWTRLMERFRTLKRLRQDASPVPNKGWPPESESWWFRAEAPPLAQSDYLPACMVPIFRPDLAEHGSVDAVHDVLVQERDLIVLTQSCDLENDPQEFAALCPVYPTSEFEQYNPSFTKKGKWDEVRKRRIAGLFLLPSPDDPQDPRSRLVVDFRLVISLPHAYLLNHAANQGSWWRLRSPYLESLSRAFGDHFSRVGLPRPLTPHK